MRLVKFQHGTEISFGVATDAGIIDVREHLAPEGVAHFREIFGNSHLLARLTELPPAIPPDEIRLLPPVSRENKIICVGANYVDHLSEAAVSEGRSRSASDHPAVFFRTLDSLVGHGQAIEKPPFSDQFDYEGELAIVVAKPGYRIPQDEAYGFVAGFTCFNDGTVRDWQKHTSQWTSGKNFFRSGSIGPWVTLIEDPAEIQTATLTTRVNGEVRQQAPVSDLIHDIPACISYVSQWTPLSPGDVISTGTPAGVGAFSDPPLFLSPGDVIEVEVDGVGTLQNMVIEEESLKGDRGGSAHANALR